MQKCFNVFVCMFVYVCVHVFQGEPGLPGSRGQEGAPGVGTQGEKVSTLLLPVSLILNPDIHVVPTDCLNQSRPKQFFEILTKELIKCVILPHREIKAREDSVDYQDLRESLGHQEQK